MPSAAENGCKTTNTSIVWRLILNPFRNSLPSSENFKPKTLLRRRLKKSPHLGFFIFAREEINNSKRRSLGCCLRLNGQERAQK